MLTIPSTVFGLMAMIILVLAGVVKRLWTDGKALQAKYDSLQEARRLDAVAVNDKTTPVLASLSQTMPLIFSKLQDGK